MLARMGSNCNFHTLLVGTQNGPGTLDTIQQFLIKSNMHLPHDPAIPLLKISPRQIKIYVHTKTYLHGFLVA